MGYPRGVCFRIECAQLGIRQICRRLAGGYACRITELVGLARMCHSANAVRVSYRLAAMESTMRRDTTSAGAPLAQSCERFFPLLVIVLVVVATSVRILVPLASPIFTKFDPISLLRSDPALIYYITERIVDAGGMVPADFRADPRIEYPETTDIPAMFTVGEEFLVAWGYLLFGSGMPLHLFAFGFMSFIASLTVVGVAGLGRELTGSAAFGVAAGALHVGTGGTYRTIGSILVREDLSLPLFALHLYLLARASRLKTPGAVMLAAGAAAAALATWHAMAFIFTMEVTCVFLWHLRTGKNPMEARASWLFVGVLILGALSIPVLQSKLFVFSAPVQMLVAMLVVARLSLGSAANRVERAATSVGVFVLLALLLTVAKSFFQDGAADYSHVLAMMVGKVQHLGQLPEDPATLPFGARLIWNGIFETGSPELIWNYIGPLSLLVLVATVYWVAPWWNGRGPSNPAIAVAFGGGALLSTLLVSRLTALAAILAPIPTVLLLGTMKSHRFRTSILAGLIVIQCGFTYVKIDNTLLKGWYSPPLLVQLGRTLHFIQDNLSGEGAIAADFVTSSALLVHTTHESILQPKYETTRSRDRIERFMVGIYSESPDAYREILRQEFGARYLIIDMPLLWRSRYTGGIPKNANAPPMGTAAHLLLNNNKAVYQSVPGYRFLFESRKLHPRYRLYELDDSSSQ